MPWPLKCLVVLQTAVELAEEFVEEVAGEAAWRSPFSRQRR
jgi:hypothetical protein